MPFLPLRIGNWHDVEAWWVAAKDFGTGPFRWVIYRGQAGELLAISQAFYLPDAAGATTKLEVSFTR
jgi:hypothetical protein